MTPPHERDDAQLREVIAEFRQALAALESEVLRRAQPRRGQGLPPARLEPSCEKLLQIVRLRCPGLLPSEQVPPGRVVDAVPVPAEAAAQMLKAALREAAARSLLGRQPRPDEELPSSLLWSDAGDELLVDLVKTDVTFGNGLVVVTIPVMCDQLPRLQDVVTVRFVVGLPDRPTGLMAAASRIPEGPLVVVRRWSEALTALAWQALLDMCTAVATQAGRDVDGTGLVPTALAATDEGLAVLPQALHDFQRVRP